MKLVGLTIAKNESDIVEAFVRHNLRLLDELIVFDNDSDDQTLVILHKLAAEGLPLTLHQHRGRNHPQVDVMNSQLRLMKDNPPDFVFILDADEFIDCESREQLIQELGELPHGCCGALDWIGFVPTRDDVVHETNPIKRITHARKQHDYYTKVVIPKAVLRDRDVKVNPGNHR